MTADQILDGVLVVLVLLWVAVVALALLARIRG